MHAPDIHLIFPPQWSPFQPFLSTASLKAYIERQGFTAVQSDWNVDFYAYFISSERLANALARLQRYVDELPPHHEAYRNHALLALGVLANHAEKHRLAEGLRTKDCLESVEAFHASVTAFKRLLYAFSVAEPVIEVGTSSLMTGDVLMSTEKIDAFCANTEANPFLPFFQRKVAEIAEEPRYFGLSIIGTEQVVPALTLAAVLKQTYPSVPILVGGSVFSRLVDKGGSIHHLLEHYFDIVVRYEGEQPLAQLLAAEDPRRDRTPNLAFLEDGAIIKTDLAPQIAMVNIPTPDFGDLDLGRYYSPEIVLPLLTTRGCYWDKCAFCYHGMIYGDRYRMRAPEMINADVEQLHAQHGSRHFAFNDEALPPKLFDRLPEAIENGKYHFTALYKFEKYYTPTHYRAMHNLGFRSLYIGLESADERVQRHMRKNNTQRVMIDNLQWAHDAGIWNHTFNFFGFPSETHTEAMVTANFLLDHAAIIHSEGTGTFSFEHNAPISKSPEAFGVTKVVEKAGNALELYYDYEVETGITSEEALALVERFGEMKADRGVYQYGGWIPREHLLVLLGRFDRDMLRTRLAALDSEVIGERRWADDLSWFTLSNQGQGERHFVVNTLAGKILETNRDAVLVLEFMPHEVPTELLVQKFPLFEQVLAA